MTHGLHHVTAIAGPAWRNLDFHGRVLGQRLIKKTVNFDDPGTWHLYFGDAAGDPGSVMTFFPWAHAAAGRPGSGETQETAFRVPRDALAYWSGRLADAGVAQDAVTDRLGDPVLAFRDPDGLRLALVGVDAAAEPAGTAGDIPEEVAIRGFHGVTLLVDRPEETAPILSALGFAPQAEEDGRTRFGSDAARGGHVDLCRADGAAPHRLGAGSVHHVAFRVADDAEQAALVARLRQDHGIVTTEQKDRNYFRSVYFRAPGGVLFEIATDGPGFAVDEAPDRLGEALKLPARYEAERARIEAALPPLTPP